MSLKEYKPGKREEVLKNAENLLETRNKRWYFRDGTSPLAKNVQKKKTKETKIDWIQVSLKI